jgi:ABC-type amino acid transport substrate-binding protein
VDTRRVKHLVRVGELDAHDPAAASPSELVTEASLGRLLDLERRLANGDLMTAAQAAAVLRVAVEGVYYRARQSHLPSVRSGQRVLIDGTAVRLLAGRLRDDDPLYTTAEAAEIAQVSGVTIARWVRGRSTEKVGGFVGVRASLLNEIMREKDRL